MLVPDHEPNPASLIAPSLDDMLALAEAAFAGLPEEFRAATGPVVIHVEDFADDATLDEMGIEDGFRAERALSRRRPDAALGDRPRAADRPRPSSIAGRSSTSGRARRPDPGRAGHPRAGARDRPPFRPVRRRHRPHRGGGGLRARAQNIVLGGCWPSPGSAARRPSARPPCPCRGGRCRRWRCRACRAGAPNGRAGSHSRRRRRRA